jgi:hypothetical protein
MTTQHSTNTFPKIHNAMWPGLVGKGSPGAEPCIDLDTMLHLTAKAEVDGIRFDGVDLFLFEPHINIDADDDAIRRFADKVAARGFVVGSVVAPVWPPTGGGSAMGSDEDRRRFVEQVRKACRIGRTLRELGIRPHGVVRIDSASGVQDWSADPEGNQAKIAQTFTQACVVAEDFGERLAAEGEICWGGMHSWKTMVDLLQRVNRPETLGFQADMAHTLLYVMGYNAPEDAILPPDSDWSDPARLDDALRTLTRALRPWTTDFHVAQNDATVHGSGTHDKTGHHCLATDPNGKLDIARHAGFWLRDESGQPTRKLRHICWDGCMFPNAVMMEPKTWNDILAAMIAVRDAHGWSEDARPELPAEQASKPVEVTAKPVLPPVKKAKPTLKKKPKPPVGRAKPAVKKTKVAARKTKVATKKTKPAAKAARKPPVKKTKKAKSGSAKKAVKTKSRKTTAKGSKARKSR